MDGCKGGGQNGQGGPGNISGAGAGPHARPGHNVATPAGSSENHPMGRQPSHDMFKGHAKHSDGEDDDIDDIDDIDDQSPDSRSLGSTSEQSLTSPAGFSSLNSLGSPASIASPSTPISQTLESSGVGATSGSDLFRPSIYGAFKPPTLPASTATSTTPAGYQPPGQPQQPHLHPMFQHHIRPPVGTDPRDSKNPLSISQLTGNFHHHPHPHLHHVGHGHPGGPGPGGHHAAPDKRALPLMT